MSSSNLLKTFGVGVDVAQQLATDKALRRKTTGTTAASVTDAITGEVTSLQGAVANLQGEVKSVTLTVSPEAVSHTLGRVPAGAIVLLTDTAEDFAITDVTDTEVEVTSASGTATITLWIV